MQQPSALRASTVAVLLFVLSRAQFMACIPVPLTAGTYTTVVEDILTTSPNDAAPDAPRPVRMSPKLQLLGMSMAIMRKLCRSNAVLNDRLEVLAVMYMMSARQGTSRPQAGTHVEIQTAATITT